MSYKTYVIVIPNAKVNNNSSSPWRYEEDQSRLLIVCGDQIWRRVVVKDVYGSWKLNGGEVGFWKV